MRYVQFDPEHLDRPTLDDAERATFVEWRKAAWIAATQAVSDYEATKTIPKEDQTIWRAHKKWLLKHFFANKCAYCEKSLSDIPSAAEHWRPKRTITGTKAAEHPGYFWLAYSWRNLLPSCDMCNSYEGKKNQFPVGNEHVFRVRLTDEELARLECPEEAIPSTTEPGAYYLGAKDLDKREAPLLLHPFIDENPFEHLEFRASGQVRGRTKKGEESIKVFALWRVENTKQRAKAYQAVLRKFVQEFEDAQEIGGFSPEEALDEARRAVLQFLREQTPFLGARLAALEAAMVDKRRQVDDE